jgi:hypothetical protein
MARKKKKSKLVGDDVGFERRREKKAENSDVPVYTQATQKLERID